MLDIKFQNNIIHCQPDPNNVPDPRGLGALLFDKIKEHSIKIHQIDAFTGETQTYQDLLSKCIKVSKYFESKNLSRDDVIGIYFRNCVDTCVPFLAGLFKGLKVCPLDITLKYEESKIFLELLKPKLLLCDENKVDDIEKALQELKIECEIIVFGESKKYTTYSELVNSNTKTENFEPVAVKNLFSTAFILFTSGTTNFPKGICVTHYGFMTQNSIFKQGHRFDRALQYSSLNWISGLISLFSNIVDGATKILCPKFEVVHTLETIQKYKVTYIWLGPVTCQKLVSSGKLPEFDLSTMLSISIAGATLPKEIYEEIRKGFPNAVICNTYGMTENSGCIFTFHPERDRNLTKLKVNSVGLPMPGSSYKVVDLETGKNLGPHQKGEIRVKHLGRMDGYYKKPGATQCAFDEEDYLCTGDLGYYDQDFCFWVERRINDIIIYRQWRMVPAELDKILLSHPAVQEAAVIGVPNIEDRQHIKGIVVPHLGSEITEKELVDYYNGKVLEHQKIRAGIKFVHELPYTLSGKLKRMELLQTELELMSIKK